MITGPCGVGKTGWPCALAQAAKMPATGNNRASQTPAAVGSMSLELAHGEWPLSRLFPRPDKNRPCLIPGHLGPDRLNASQNGGDLMEIGRGQVMRPDAILINQPTCRR